MSNKNYVIGIDYGTDSVRSIIVDAANGEEIASDVHNYPRWKEGRYCDPAKNQFRQHPLDYLEGLEVTVQNALSNAPDARDIKGISIDTTGSTPIAVNQEGTPLSLTDEFADNPNAMFVLWKDHTAVDEAADINQLAKSRDGIDYTKYVGGVYSSEWFWAKLLHIIRNDAKVREAAFSWIEHCDWISAELTGETDPLILKRSRCAAGHKAMWHPEFQGLPSEDFLVKLDPLLKGLREQLFTETYTSDQVMGTLSGQWAEKLGLSEEVVIGVGAFDAHMGAVGGNIEPFHLSKVMGTSTCDMLIAPNEEFGDKLIRGICGQVDGSIIPGMLGMEAGQSGFGDVYAWFKDVLMWPVTQFITDSDQIEQIESQIIPALSGEAEKLDIETTMPLALDWLNGRRTPDANQRLKGAIAGLSLASDAPQIFKALVESTAFGAKRIVESFTSQGVPVHGIIGLGGVAKKSPYIMQVIADVLNMPIRIARSEQACALGAAMFAATVAGIYPNVQAAQKAMGSGFEETYQPIASHADKYQAIYEKYKQFGEFIEKEMTE